MLYSNASAPTFWSTAQSDKTVDGHIEKPDTATVADTMQLFTSDQLYLHRGGSDK